MFEIVAGELRAKLGMASATPQARAEHDTRAVGHGRGARGRRRGLAGLRGDAPSNISDQAPLVWRAPERPVGMAAVLVGGGGAWPGFKRSAQPHTATRRHWCGGRRRDPWAWPRCWWAAVGPGRASRRRAEQHQRPGATGVEGTGETRGPGCGARGRQRSQARLVTAT